MSSEDIDRYSLRLLFKVYYHAASKSYANSSAGDTLSEYNGKDNVPDFVFQIWTTATGLKTSWFL